MADFIKVLSAATVCTLADKQLVVIIHTAEKDYAIPICKKDSAMFWYYLLKDMSEKDMEVLNAIFDVLKKKFSVIPSKLNSFPCVDELPEHSHTIVEVVRPNVTGFVPVIPANFEEICEKLGYTYAPIMRKSVTRGRDYSNIAKDPKYAKFIEDNHARVEALKLDIKDAPNEAKVAFEGLKNGFYDCVMFKGPTGTGKTELARLFADKLGAPIETKQVEAGTRAEDFIGDFFPSDKKDVPFEFIPGPLLSAYTDGYGIQIDEILNATPETLAKLNAYLDGSPYVRERDKIYYKHPNFFAIVTCNPGYEGTMPMNVSLKNRMSTVEMPAITKETFIKWAGIHAENLGRKFPEEFFDKLFDLAAVIEKEGKSPKWHENFKFSIRNAQRFIEAIAPKDCDINAFKDAFHIQYTNFLSMDNDNSDMLAVYKQNDDLNKRLKALFELYETTKSTVKTTSEVLSIEDLLSATEAVDKIKIDDGAIPIDTEDAISALFK